MDRPSPSRLFHTPKRNRTNKPDLTSQLYDAILKDPLKKAKVLQLLSQDKHVINDMLRKEGLVAPNHARFESPVVQFRKKMLAQMHKSRHESDSESSTGSSGSVVAASVPYEKLMEGVVAYVEVKTRNGDRSAATKAVMRSMGATIREEFTKDVTHVVFKDSSFGTYQKAKLMKRHLVSLLWVEAVRKNHALVPEKDYPALGTDVFDGNLSNLCQKMQEEYEEALQDEVDKTLDATSPKKPMNHRATALPSELSRLLSSGSVADAKNSLNSTPANTRRKTFHNTVSENNSFSSGGVSDCGMIDGEVTEKIITSLNLSSPDGKEMSVLKSVENIEDSKQANQTTSSVSTSDNSTSLLNLRKSQVRSTRGNKRKPKKKEEEENVQKEMKRSINSNDSSTKISSIEEMPPLRISTDSSACDETKLSSLEGKLTTSSTMASLRLSSDDSKAKDKPNEKSTTSEPSAEISKQNPVEVDAKKKTRRKLYNPAEEISGSILLDADGENSTGDIANVQFKKPTLPLTPVLLTTKAKRFFNDTKKRTFEKDLKTPPKLTPKRRQKVLSTPKTTTKTSPNESQRETRKTRSSSFYFDTTPTKITPKKNKTPTSIVCTRLHSPEVHVFQQIVKKLGGFFLEDEVTCNTSHLVAGEPKRTINMLRAVARGCWILRHEWLLRSLEAGKWLPEEEYELTEFSRAVQRCRIERQAFGSGYSMDIFQNCGYIYVARSTIPRRSDLQELVKICKGKLTTSLARAEIVVGERVPGENLTCVKEIWILDSIADNKLKPLKNYLL